MKKILVINDFVSLGKMAGKMMDAILSYKNYDVFFLPTALIANNFSYGKNAELDTTEYLKSALDNWEDIGFKFDLIFIGYINSKEQKDILIDYINKLSYKPTIFVDPIMGDDGSLYKGLDQSMVDNYKDLVKIADLISPNQTEAELLNMDLKSLGISYFITSKNEGDKYFVEGFDREEFTIPFEKLPGRLTGTGDMFDGFLIIYLLEGKSLEEAGKKTVELISKIYKLAIEEASNENINIERYLYLID